ncbi:MAG TPA: nucleoside triphosphate pyrophosphohydrolase family protein [Candidatus Moranbacteria bacterium]|nr:nucleoside triphosphate pyrophosphohydrolase family protein [Candidatus Moranbacteria bacterium]
MDFNEYQKKALETNLEKEDKFKELMQQVLGLADEAGEVQALFKKWIRDDNADFEKIKKEEVKKELGDVLWYIAVIAHDLEIELNEIAENNIAKLADRMERGKIGGSGDNR